MRLACSVLVRLGPDTRGGGAGGRRAAVDSSATPVHIAQEVAELPAVTVYPAVVLPWVPSSGPSSLVHHVRI